MTANQLLDWVGSCGVRVTLNGDNLKVDMPAEGLTDQLREKIKHYIKCYKTELLWRLRRPEGDPPASGYQVPVNVNGERVTIPLDRLIAEGNEVMARENIPPSKTFDPDMWAASVALSRYDERHRQWAEARL